MAARSRDVLNAVGGFSGTLGFETQHRLGQKPGARCVVRSSSDESRLFNPSNLYCYN